MFKGRKGGELVDKGSYWNFSTGERVIVDESQVLPGNAESVYYKFRPIFMLLIAPVLGLAYAMFLPFIGIAMTASLLVKKTAEVVGGGLSRAAVFGWRPSEAYLAGKNKKDKNKVKDNE